MINVIKEIMFDCAYENVVQAEVIFEQMAYNLKIEMLKVRYILCYRF